MKTEREKFDTLDDGPGLTMREIAAIEGISYQGVYYALKGAYRKLRRTPGAIALLRAAADEAEQRRRRERVEVSR